MNTKSWVGIGAAALLMSAGASASYAQATYTEDFTQATTTNKWYFYDGACLTAGNSTSLTQPNYIPSCGTIWTQYYSKQQTNQSSADTKLVGGANGTSTSGVTTTALDTPGNGALRFTNGSYTNGNPGGAWEDGSIVSASTFDASQGVQITFKVVSYHGNSGGPGGDGADGLGFLLMDGSLTPGTAPYNGIGAVGGSLGYACSNINPPYDGLIGAYIGLGIDEFGNFLHGAQLYPGYTGSNVVNPSNLGYSDPEGDNGQYGYGFHPNRIGLRGAGNVSWTYLSTKYAYYYPSSILNTATLQQNAVRNTCITGSVLNYHSNAYASCTVGNGPGSTSSNISGCPSTVSAATLSAGGFPAFYDYAPIQNGYVELPTTGSSAVQIANESAVARPTGLTTNGVTSGNVFQYNLKITTDGYLSLSYSLNGSSSSVSVLKSQSITASNGTLPATLRFGFSAASGGSTNIHELLCFKAAPVVSSATSASTDQQQTGKLETNSQAYFAYYDPNDWTGRMTAYGLSFSSTGVVTIASTANWDSQCVLTGVANLSTSTCPTTGVNTPANAQSPTTGTTGSRVILTWDGVSSGVPFEWPSSSSAGGITTAEESTLDAGDTTPINANRLNYLRGNRSLEVQTNGSGTFRTRDGVLGDIVDSSPVWVGPPSSPYALPFKDRLIATDATPENASTSTSYANFITNNQYRLNVVYAGANDGFLHGFRTGSQDASGNILTSTPTTPSVSTPNDGLEVIAYMPGTVLNTIHNATNAALDLSSPQYGHNFFVDATPGTGDLFYGGAWHTWLVGGLGVGGADIYALDITNPSAFSESTPTSVVIGDWNASTISCYGDTSSKTCKSNLGNTYGTPLIRRLHNGMWGVIFGNGFGSSSGDAGIYVMTIDQTSGAKTFYYLSTSTGSSSSPNGIAYTTAADLDGDHITDYVYAGDLQGNVWRFDLTSATPSSWAVSTGPLFKTQTGQPITTPVVLASALVVGTSPALIVSFGTGQRTQLTNTTSTSYSTATQSLYGVWDWNFSTWNAASSSQYASLSTAQVRSATNLSSPYTLTMSNLQVQSFTTGSNSGSIESSNATVTWAQCAAAAPYTCNGGEFGWYANLAVSTSSKGPEQVVSVPTLFQQALILNTTVPAINNPLSCDTPAADTGNTYIISVTSGGTFTSSGTTTKLSGFLTNSDSNTVGENTNETGALSVVRTATTTTLIGQLNNPVAGTAPGAATPFSLPTNLSVNRMTWTQLR